MTTTFTIKRNDTAPPIEATLSDADGVVDLSGGSVEFHMRSQRDGTLKVERAASVVSGPAGTVRYDWLAADTDTDGVYAGEFEATLSDGRVVTFPNTGNISITITADQA